VIHFLFGRTSQDAAVLADRCAQAQGGMHSALQHIDSVFAIRAALAACILAVATS
jgi:hypothetical protein